MEKVVREPVVVPRDPIPVVMMEAPPRPAVDLVPEGMRRFTDLRATMGVLPDAALRPVLPFGPASGPAEETSADALKQSVERYASLCIDLERAPERAGEALARYRLTAEQKGAIDDHWRRRMSDAETRARWEEACRVYRAWLASQGR